MRVHPDRKVEEFLTDAEEIVHTCPPDMLGASVSELPSVALAAVFAGIGLSSRSTVVVAIGLLVALALVLHSVWTLLSTWYTRYVLTDHRAMRVSGLVGTDCEWVSWSKVTDVSINRTVLDWLLKTATIRIQSANESSSFKTMRDVPRPMEFADAVTRAVNARQGRVTVVPTPSGRRRELRRRAAAGRR